MCLITSLTKPFVAKKDIICYKYLNKCGDVYSTPMQKVDVKLCEKMVADTKRSYERGDWNNCQKHEIGDGFIHATLGSSPMLCNVIVKAIIPAGTEFYIDDNCTEICARELILTNELIEPSDMPEEKIAIRELFDDYFKDFFEPSDVAVGYYRLADGSYVNPTNLTDEIKDEIIGVVACIRDNKVHVVSLDGRYLQWCDDNWDKSSMVCSKQYTDPVSAENDFDGEGNTKAVLSHDTYCSERYPAFAWIANYETKGTKKGDWHMGACGEVTAIGRYNQLKINIALALLDNSVLIDYLHHWSSSEDNNHNAWYLEVTNGNVGSEYKRYDYIVRAFITFDA